MGKKPQTTNGCDVVTDSEPPSSAHTPEQDRHDAVEERAAVLEYDGGLTREEAERQAAGDLGIPAGGAA